MKVSPNASPALVSQICAYQQNFFWVANLIEDSQTKAAALGTIQEMEKKIQEVLPFFTCMYMHMLHMTAALYKV